MIELSEGQTRLINAAKYLYKRWSTTPIRSADINDKLASDKLVWLVHNFHDAEEWGYTSEFPETVVIKAV